MSAAPENKSCKSGKGQHNQKYLQVIRIIFQSLRYCQGKDIEKFCQQAFDQIIGECLVIIPPHSSAHSRCHSIHNLVHGQISNAQKSRYQCCQCQLPCLHQVSLILFLLKQEKQDQNINSCYDPHINTIIPGQEAGKSHDAKKHIPFRICFFILQYPGKYQTKAEHE